MGLGMIRNYYKCSRTSCDARCIVSIPTHVHRSYSECDVTYGGEHNHECGAFPLPSLQIRGNPIGPRKRPVPKLPKRLPVANSFLWSIASYYSDQYVICMAEDLRNHPMVHCSAGFCRLTNFSPEECIGRDCRILQGKSTNVEAIATMADAITRGVDIRLSVLNYRRNGEAFWNDLHIFSLGQGLWIAFMSEV